MARPIVRRVLWVLIVLIGLVVLVLIIWVVVAGPITVARIIRYGDTDIDDFSHYPGRQLQPSDAPVVFARRDIPLDLPTALLSEYGYGGDLDTLLEANDTIALVIIRGDTVLYERYFQGHAPSSRSQLFSVSKSFTSALIGMAIADGYIESVEQPITDFVPELADEGFDQVTLHHLLTMMSGSSYVENDNPFGEHVILNYTPELKARILEFEMEDAPGEIFRYKSGDNALLALALDRALGAETVTAYAQRRLWAPLGMQDPGVWTLDHVGDGLEKTWCCLAASARDVAKLGRLYLNQGQWDGEQIVPRRWVEASTSGQVPATAWPDRYRAVGWWNYGYQWWLASREARDVFALGKDGQFLYLNPDADLIVVRLGWSTGDLRTSAWIKLFQALAAQIGAD